MSDKELEIRHQFLDEAQDYLDNLENSLVGLAGGTMNVQAVNSAMRSAHSIKGGAGMMGFQLLNQLAHRLEDSLKVIKIQKHAVDVNAELEQMLLSAVDCLRRIALSDRRGEPIDAAWLESQALPLFEQLHDRLGDPQEEDAASILSPEENQDIVPLLFQTEVEGCLERLEGVLDGDRHCLYEETEILAQELEALGEMLQLPAFSQLCKAVLETMRTQPDQIDGIAREALAAWRQTQRLVLAGNYSELPTGLPMHGAAADADAITGELDPLDADIADTIDITVQPDTLTPDRAESDVAASYDEEPEALQSWEDAIAQADSAKLEESPDLADWSALDNDDIAGLADWPDAEMAVDADSAAISPISSAPPTDSAFEDGAAPLGNLASLPSEIDSAADSLAIEADVPGTDVPSGELSYGLTVGRSAETVNDREFESFESFESFDADFSETIAVDDSGFIDYRDGREPAPSKPRVDPTDRPSTKPSSSESDDVTVRVPVRQLKQLNNLFGELTIERNGLELYLKRLHALLATLRQRVKTLDQTNLNLRSAYDRVTTRAELEHSPLAIATRQPLRSKMGQRMAADELTEDFDVLELDQYSDMHLMSQEVMETIVQIQEVTTDLEISMDDTDHTFRNLNKTAKQLQTKMTQLQMRPLSDILERFPRALRKMSLEHGKSAELKVYGGNLLIDRNILEALNEPLLHLLRNAFDHGIEDPETRQGKGKPAQGTIEIRALHRNNRTLISIHDDGKGIDLDKIRDRARQMGLDDMLLAAASDDELISLIFEPGFSTSSRVTDLSGRGVGMDVVRDGIKQLQGEISVDTVLNQGTTFTLSLPFTLSVTRVLLVESNDMMLAFPTDVIEEMTSISSEQVLKTIGGEALEWEDQVVQFIRLQQWLRFNCPRSLESPETVPNINESTVLMVSYNDQLVGLQVKRCWGEQEVAIRYVEGNLPMPPGFSSCTILGDGRVVPMVNVSELLRWIMSDERARSTSKRTPQELSTEQPAIGTLSSAPETSVRSDIPEPPLSVQPQSRKPAVLIVDDSINVRRFLALTLEKAGYRVEQAKDGQDAIDKLLAGLPVQAVICDIEMPRLDGYGVLARVKSNSSLAHMPVAMLTSRSGEKHRKLAMSLGASAYFSKPYNEQMLLQTLRQIVESTVAV